MKFRFREWIPRAFYGQKPDLYTGDLGDVRAVSGVAFAIRSLEDRTVYFGAHEGNIGEAYRERGRWLMAINDQEPTILAMADKTAGHGWSGKNHRDVFKQVRATAPQRTAKTSLWAVTDTIRVASVDIIKANIRLLSSPHVVELLATGESLSLWKEIARNTVDEIRAGWLVCGYPFSPDFRRDDPFGRGDQYIDERHVYNMAMLSGLQKSEAMDVVEKFRSNIGRQSIDDAMVGKRLKHAPDPQLRLKSLLATLQPSAAYRKTQLIKIKVLKKAYWG